MPKSKSALSQPVLPSREEIFSFIEKATSSVTKRDIAQAFHIKGADRIWLKQVLKEAQASGLLKRDRKAVHKAGQLPPVVLADITGKTRDGDLLAEPGDWDSAEDGPIPKILVMLPHHRSRAKTPAPGIGDKVLLRLSPVKGEDTHRYSGRVIKLIAKQRPQAIGIFHAIPNGGGRIIPVDKKSRDREWLVQPGDEGDAGDGDLVTASVSKTGPYGPPLAKIKERLGSLGSEKAISLIAIHAHGIPHIFPQPVLKEAEAARPMPLDGREDWRTIPLVTIDPPDAKDHDDAVYAAKDEDPTNPGGFVLSIAIADVAAYVRPGSPLDKEALERGNSVYFPDRVVPMLPERISNDLCSLRPNEDRPALAVKIVIDKEGHKKRHSFHRVMMRSAAKLSYQAAQAAIDGQGDTSTLALLDPVLRPLWAAYGALAKARDARGPIALDMPERKILLNPDGTVDRVTVPDRLEAHRLIEEFMIQANVAAAEFLEKASKPLIYRVHDEPSREKMRALGEVLASIGIKLPKEGALQSALFNRILSRVEGSPHDVFINEVVLRSQSQAEYAAENYGHFGLNLRRYAHFTSPIRRYADLIVHRALISALNAGSDGLPTETTLAELTEISGRISIAERRAMAAERETVDRLIAHHLADRIGSDFSSQIAGVTGAGLFVKLQETGADGFIPIRTLGDDYFRYDEKTHSLKGQRGGKTFRLGDRIEVKLVEAAPVAGALRFEILGGGIPRKERTKDKKYKTPEKRVKKSARKRRRSG